MEKRYIPRIGEKVYYVSKYSLEIISTTVHNIYGNDNSLELKEREYSYFSGVREDYYKDYADAYLRLEHFINLEKTRLAKKFYKKMLALDKILEI